MDFEPTSEEHAVAQAAARAAAEVLPRLSVDPIVLARDAHAELGKRGLFEAPSTVAAALAVAELARASASLGGVLAQGWLFADALRRYGPADGSMRPLAVAAGLGTVLGCLALDGATLDDTGNLVRENVQSGGPVISGRPRSVLCAPIASHAIVAARSSETEAVVACIDLASSGVRRIEPVTAPGGLPRAPLDFGRTAIRKSTVLAEGKAGAELSRALVAASSIVTAAVAVGVARRAMDRAAAHVRSLERRPPQSTELLLSDLATELDAATLAMTHAAWLRDAGASFAAESASARLLSARTATRIAHGALRVSGETGYDDDLRRTYLDAAYLETHDGSEAEQIDIIAGDMLGE